MFTILNSGEDVWVKNIHTQVWSVHYHLHNHFFWILSQRFLLLYWFHYFTSLLQLAQHLLGRELEPWETIFVGALSGGLAAVTTTPFDVMKTRMMTAPQGRPISMSMVAFSILRQEGPLGLFKGAVPRFFWIAPLGAMNFAGYELARKALNKSEEAAVMATVNDQLPPRK